jgi:hypothetical protein
LSTFSEHHERRLGLLQEALRERGEEALWVEPSVGLFYLTGLEPVSLERLFGLLVLATERPRMVVPLLLADECEHIEVADHVVWRDAEGPKEATTKVLDGVSSLLVQGDHESPRWRLEFTGAGLLASVVAAAAGEGATRHEGRRRPQDPI